MTATWTNSKETGVSHVGDTSEATSYRKRKLNMAKSLIVTTSQKTLISVMNVECPIWPEKGRKVIGSDFKRATTKILTNTKDL